VAISNQHYTDKRLARALADFFAGWTVVGFGEGIGAYRKFVLSTGKVRTYDAYDGSPFIRNITGGKVIWRYTHVIFYLFYYLAILA